MALHFDYTYTLTLKMFEDNKVPDLVEFRGDSNGIISWSINKPPTLHLTDRDEKVAMFSNDSIPFGKITWHDGMGTTVDSIFTQVRK